MSEVLTVQTNFGDLRELSAGLVGRIEPKRLILYGSAPFEEGEEVGFAILFADNSPALEGSARVTATVDGGEDREPGSRYDIVLDSLELDVINDAKLESIVIAMNPEDGDRITGEVSTEDLDAQAEADEAEAEEAEADEPAEAEEADEAEEALSDAADAEDGEEDSEIAETAADDSEYAVDEEERDDEPEPEPEEGPLSFGDAPPAAEPPAAPAPPPGFQVSHVGDEGVVLLRTAMASDWTPTPMERAEVSPPSGFFAYTGELPTPAGPPHPELPSGAPVTPAPSPAAGGVELADADAGAENDALAESEPSDESSEEALEALEGEYEAGEAEAEEAAEADDGAYDEVEEAPVEGVDETALREEDAEGGREATAEVDLEDLEEL